MNWKSCKVLLVAATFAMCASGCSENSPSTPPSPSNQLFSDQKTENYSMSFTGNFPTEAPDATAIASDASGKGPFSVGIACDGGGSLNLKIDNSTNHKIDCDGSKNKIDGIQKVALAGGVKLKISSDKQDGAWKIQLIGAKP